MTTSILGERDAFEREVSALTAAGSRAKRAVAMQKDGGEPPPMPSVEPAPSPAPFARAPRPGSYWPLRSSSPRTVALPPPGTRREANRGRWFGALRTRDRLHAAVDLYGSMGDPVIACEDGEVLNFFCFLPSNAATVAANGPAGDRTLIERDCRDGTATYALLVRHDDLVINYGEVDPDTTRALGLHKRGTPVRAGQLIARVGQNPGNDNMLHFEIYRASPQMLKTPRNQRWIVGHAPHEDALDPTRYLAALQAEGLVAPVGGVTGAGAARPTGTTSQGGGSVIGGVSSLLSTAQLLARGLWSAAAHAAILAGHVDENTLTNLIFDARHPERGGAKLQPHETTLVREWLGIRDTIIRPLLHAAASASGPSTSNGAGPAPGAQTSAQTSAQPSSAPSTPARPLPAPAAPAGTVGDDGHVWRHPKNRSAGYDRSGGGYVDAVLPRLRSAGLLSITDDDIAVLQRMSNVETGGVVQSINSWDSAYMSMGFIQLTIMHTDPTDFPDGKLQRLIHAAAPAFARYGIVLERTRRWSLGSGRVKNTPLALVGVGHPRELRELEWAKRFWAAGLDPEIIAAEARVAGEILHEALQRIAKRSGGGDDFKRFYGGSVSLRALVQESFNHRPAWLYEAVRRTLARARAEGTTSPDRFLVLLRATIRAVWPEMAASKGKEEVARMTRSAENLICKTSAPRIPKNCG